MMEIPVSCCSMEGSLSLAGNRVKADARMCTCMYTYRSPLLEAMRL